MIKERSSYSSDLPVNIRIVNIEEYPLHFHQDIEFVHVLKGEINLKCGYFTYKIGEGNVFTVNGREVHGLYKSDGENIVALVQINNYYFSHYFDRISSTCFRTFTSNNEDKRLDSLRMYLSNIISESLKKEPGYKHQIVDIVNHLLTYLDENFHYFSFEDKVVVNRQTDNPIVVERLSRIINYIYEKHSEKITLKELSDIEHLSTFYISHLITEGTGMNFREFLCFARVEFSEMQLLDTNKKINAIAEEVGFSTSAYYIKYFKKWFGLTPAEYRKKYINDIQAPTIPAKLKKASYDEVIKIISTYLEYYGKYGVGLLPNKTMRIGVNIQCDAPTLRTADINIIPHSKANIINKRFESVIQILNALKIDEIEIIPGKDDESIDYDKLIKRLALEGIKSRLTFKAAYHHTQIYGLDSIASIPYIISLALDPDLKELTLNSLIDGSDESILLKGEDGILTAGLVPKPSYYAYRILREIKGELIDFGKYHAVTRQPGINGEPDSFGILFFNQNEQTKALCKRSSSLQESIEGITKFEDGLDIHLHIKGLFGFYQFTKLRFRNENSAFAYSCKTGFFRKLEERENQLCSWLSSPQIDITTELLTGSLHLSSSFMGLEAQCIVVTPILEDPTVPE